MAFSGSFLPGVSFLALMAGQVMAGESVPNVTDVTVSSTGVAQLTREFVMKGDETVVPLRLYREDVDDFLGSLIVTGDPISNAMVSLRGPAPLGETLSRMGITGDQLGSLEGLVSAFRGETVAVRDVWGRERTGRVLGFTRGDCTVGGDDDGVVAAACHDRMTLVDDDDGIHQLSVPPSSEIRFTDPHIRETVRKASEALAAGSRDGIRMAVATLTHRGLRGEHKGRLSHVANVPEWKSAYKAEVRGDVVDLQAWAVVENGTGEDWKDISLTLSSGNPRVLKAGLFERSRPPGSDWPEPFARQIMVKGAVRAGGPEGVAMMDSRQAPMAEMEPAVSSSESDVDARFAFEEKVTVNAGDMISLPFLSGTVEARRAGYIDGSRASDHPGIAIMIENNLPITLPGGVISLSGSGAGYRGDSRIDALAPGGETVAVFAADRKVRLISRMTHSKKEVRTRISGGVLEVRASRIHVRTYALDSEAQDVRRIVIDHPVHPDRKMDTVDGATRESETRLLSGGREAIRLEFGLEPGGRHTVVVREREPLHRQYALADLSDSQISGLILGEISPGDRKTLETVSELRAGQAAVERELIQVRRERDDTVEEQERLLTMMDGMPEGSEARDRYLRGVVGKEDVIGRLDNRISKLSLEKREIGDRLDRIIRSS